MFKMRTKLGFALALILSIVFVSGVPEPLGRATAATDTTISGVINVVYGDPPGFVGPHRTGYFLADNAGELWSLDVPPSVAAAAGGPAKLDKAHVNATGDEKGARRLAVTDLDVIGDGGAFAAPSTEPLAGTQNFVTLLCKFSDFANEDEDVGFFTDLMNTQDDFWQENSYDNVSITHTEYDWRTLADTRDSYLILPAPPFPEDDVELVDLADDCAALFDDDVDFSSVYGIHFVFNATIGCCAWGGSVNFSLDGKAGFKTTWMPPWAWTQGVFAHETSHAFTLKHEGCQGSTTPYDSPWDPVSAAALVHSNSAYKDILDWIPGARTYTADSSLNQVVQLERLALPGPGGDLMAVIPLPGGTYYTIEARKFAGYDEDPTGIPQEAVVMHIVDTSLEDKHAQVLRKDTGVASCGANGAWEPGDLFVDEENAVKVAVVAEGSTGFTVIINPTADLSITKSSTPNPAVAGQLLTYNVAVTNEGPSPAGGIVVTDVLPANVTYVADTDACVQGPVGTLTCTYPGILADGDTWNFDITVDVDPSLIATTGPATITNTVEVSSNIDDTDLGNNEFELVTLVVDSADLRIAKECKPDQPNAAPAGTVTFCDIYVDNLGPSDARDVVVTDQIISSVPVTVTSIQLTSTEGSPGTCAPATPIGPATNITITCTDSILPVGARNTIKVFFTANDAGDVNNTASVRSATPDPNMSNNQAVGRVSFAAAADLLLVKEATPDPVVAGEDLTYTITVTNNGPSTATAVVVRDNLPGALTNVSVSSPGNTCNAGVPGNPAQPMTCNLGNMADGAIEIVTVVGTVKADTPDGTILFNQARVSSATPDTNNDNNLDSVPIDVEAEADVLVTKTSDSATYKPNTTVRYKVTITNNGSSDAQNVVVVDQLLDSKKLVYESDTGGCIFQQPTTVTCNVGTLKAGETKEFFIFVKVKGAFGLVPNQVNVSSTTFDPNMANNQFIYNVTVQGGKP